MLPRTYIPTGERGLRFRRGDLVAVLRPGTHRASLRDLFAAPAVLERHAISAGRFGHKRLDVLTRDPRLANDLIVIDLPDEKRALVWRDGRLFDVLGPGLTAYWREAGDWRVESFDVGELRFEHKQLQVVLSHPKAAAHLGQVRVEDNEAVLLYRDGRFVEVLSPGLHVFWKAAGRLWQRQVDLREQTLDVGGQEILTADKVSLRVNLVVTLAVVDPVRAVRHSEDWQQSAYRAAQLALRVAVGGRTLDGLLSAKEAVGDEVGAAVSQIAGSLGVRVTGVGLRDVILPGDMRELFNGVIAAQKRAEADLIRRREETAAARSQANTARLLADNPGLQRLRELELLRDVLADADVTFVLGDGANNGPLPDQLRRLVAAE